MKKVVTSLILIILILEIFCTNFVFADDETTEPTAEGTTVQDSAANSKLDDDLDVLDTTLDIGEDVVEGIARNNFLYKKNSIYSSGSCS